MSKATKKRPPLQGTLTPAYGRDYKSKEAVITDFQAGKDFKLVLIASAGYCSIRDYNEGDMVKIRYNKLRHAVFYRVTKEDLRK